MASTSAASSSGHLTPTPDRDRARESQMEEWGAHCQRRDCNTLDFLPFKCSHCSKTFCSDHWKAEFHGCERWDASMGDNRAPTCPLCSQPIPLSSRTQDPNIPMDAHLTTSCPVLNTSTGLAIAPDSNSSSRPGGKPKFICPARGCKTKLVEGLGIGCDGCGMKYCARHRMRDDHDCGKAGVVKGRQTATKTTSSSGQSNKGGPSPSAGGLGIGIGAASSKAGLAAIRRVLNERASSAATSMNQAEPRTPVTATTVSASMAAEDDKVEEKVTAAGPSKVAAKNPFSKVERMSKKEQESRRKALEARRKKGLLTEQEKLAYATEMALHGQHEHEHGQGGGRKEKGDCVIC